LCAFQTDNEPITAPNLNVVTVNQALRLGYGLAVVATTSGSSLWSAVKANGISPVLCHPGLLQRPQFAGKELGDLRGPQRVITGAIETLEFATARLPKQEAHGFAVFGTDWRRVFLGMTPHAGSGASTGLTVTDWCRGWVAATPRTFAKRLLRWCPNWVRIAAQFLMSSPMCMGSASSWRRTARFECGIFQAHRRLELYDDLANRGIRTANVPLVPGIQLPHQLKHLSKPLVVSLTANALARIICRTGASRAAFIAHCYQEALAITEEHKLVVLASHKH
jgi:hypothetical protein